MMQITRCTPPTSIGAYKSPYCWRTAEIARISAYTEVLESMRLDIMEKIRKSTVMKTRERFSTQCGALLSAIYVQREEVQSHRFFIARATAPWFAVAAS